MKIIPMNHEICDTNCMWNGLEDIYRTKTGMELPPYFFFCLSAFCSPVYQNNPKSDVPKAMYFNSGLPKKMYDFMKNIIGFEYSVIENRGFQYALKKAKEQIDRNRPVLIGATDMYFLEYHKKFFHHLHIPIHFVLMIGYDDDNALIYLLDCSKSEPQALSYENLEKAWDVSVDGFSKKNTLFIIEFSEYLSDVKTIFYESLREKVAFNLYSTVCFAGIKSIRKLADEIADWHKKMTQEQYTKCLLHIVEHTGFPPSISERYNKKDRTHHGARYKFADLLRWASQTYDVTAFGNAADAFVKSGDLLNNLSFEIYQCVLTNSIIGNEIVDLLYDIAEIEELGFKIIENAVRN